MKLRRSCLSIQKNLLQRMVSYLKKILRTCFISKFSAYKLKRVLDSQKPTCRKQIDKKVLSCKHVVSCRKKWKDDSEYRIFDVKYRPSGAKARISRNRRWFPGLVPWWSLPGWISRLLGANNSFLYFLPFGVGMSVTIIL